MTVSVINPSEDKRWDEFVLNHPMGSVYQLSSYEELIRQTFRQATPYYIIIEEGNKIKAGVPFFLLRSWLMGTRMVSLPFSSYSDLLVDNKDQFDAIFEKARKILEENRGSNIEFRMLKNGHAVSDRNILRKEEGYKYHILKIQGSPDSMMKSFHKTCIQNRIKKAIKNNVSVARGQTDEDLRAFYHVLVHNRRHLGLPPQPFLLFENFRKFLSDKGIFELLLAKWNDRVVAGFILLKFKKTIIIDYIAQNHDFDHISPAHLLFWETIRMAFRDGYQYVDFGKSGSENMGLIIFKKRWGCQEYDLPYYYYPNSEEVGNHKESSTTYKLANQFFKWAPLWMGRVVSRFLYKHLG